MPEKIDFVLPWVDGSDLSYQAEMKRYLPEGKSMEEHRFRDWGLLRYWFRAVEIYAPYANRIHFITCGQCPDWLDTTHPKLNMVHHRDYIPAEYLPCFSSHPIELNMHRIPELSQCFVYFNDDTFLLRPVEPELFFHKGLPRLRACLESRTPFNEGIYYYINNAIALSAHFDMLNCIRKNRSKWFDMVHNGPRTVLRNLLYLKYFPYTNLCNNNHMPTPYRKDLIEQVWREEPELLARVSSHRFRQNDDVNQWLFHNWTVASGAFFPIRQKELGQFHMLADPLTAKGAAEAVRNRKSNMICLNDDITSQDDFETCRQSIEDAFSSILPQRSSYERY